MERPTITSTGRIVRACSEKTSAAGLQDDRGLLLGELRQGIEYRRVTTTDFRDHLLRLSAADRYLRFGQCMTDELIRSYTTSPAPAGFTFGMFDGDQARGIVELKDSSGEIAGLELGLTIEAHWRGRGHGTSLVVHALASARVMKSGYVFAQINRSNTNMRSIAEKLGAKFTERQGELFAEWAIAPAAV
jgi:GNAT superfamily N-acetyltransferase